MKTLSVNEHITTVRRIFEQAVNARDFTVVDELFAPDYVAHSALLGTVSGPESFKRAFRGFTDPCPDFQGTLEDLFSAGDKVTARVTYRGTDTGGMFGRPPTGTTFTLGAIYIFRLGDGLVRELWQEADLLGLQRQLGLIPTTR